MSTVSQPNTDLTRTSNPDLTIHERTNDKLVIVSQANYADLKKVLTGFCKSYNKEENQALPKMTKLSESEFAITFPQDIDFEIFCYFINYIKYPMEVKWRPDVVAWTTTKKGDIWTTEKSVNKKVMLFIPKDDTEYDNVYLTTVDNIGYKLGFAVGEQNQLLTVPIRAYIKPTIELSSLITRQSEAFK